jgi:hypothetical protein
MQEPKIINGVNVDNLFGTINVIAAAKILNFAGVKFPRQIGLDGVRPVGEIRQEQSFPLRG